MQEAAAANTVLPFAGRPSLLQRLQQLEEGCEGAQASVVSLCARMRCDCPRLGLLSTSQCMVSAGGWRGGRLC